MYESFTAQYWFNFRGPGDVGVKKQTHTREIVIRWCQPNYTSPLHNLQHGMTSLCIFGPELRACGAGVEASDSTSRLQPAALLSSSRLASLLQAVSLSHASSLTEITHRFPPSCAISRLTRCQKGCIVFWFFFLRTHWKTTFKVPPGTAAQWHLTPVIAFKMFRQKLSLTLRANSMTIKQFKHLYIILYMFCLSGL